MVLLKNKQGDLGSSLRFSLSEMPCFTLWKNTAADGCVTGLEPATNYPNPKPFEQSKGRVVILDGGETRRFDLTVAVHDTRRQVLEVEREIKRLQKTVRPKICLEPFAQLSPEA